MHIYPKRASLDGLGIEILKLVSYSATPEQWKEWLSVPLEHAAARGNLELFNKLLGAGADGRAGWRGCRDRTLLDAAAVGGNEDIVSGLLRVGAQPDVDVVSCSSKRSALYTATMLGHESVARRLVIAGADVNFEDPLRQRSVLHEAIKGGHEQLVADVLIGGADPDSRDGDEDACPLHFAAVDGYDRIVSTLLLRGAYIDALDGDHGETPLMWASGAGQFSAVKTLLAAGADAGIRSNDDCTALDRAAMNGRGDVIEAIVGHGADVNAVDDSGATTSLHWAAHRGQTDAVDALIKAGADVELKTLDGGNTPLSLAVLHDGYNVMLALLQHGAKVDNRNNVGDTPLHMACSLRRVGVDEVVDLLLRWGADETALNYDGQRPAEVLDVDNDEDVRYAATQEGIERTRLLLSRAPADRAWRRRGWLVMLRSRAVRAMSTRSSDGDGGIEGDGPGVGDGGRDGEGCKAARRDEAGRGADRVARRETGTDAGASGSNGEGGMLSGVGMQPEGVFRAIVGYL